MVKELLLNQKNLKRTAVVEFGFKSSKITSYGDLQKTAAAIKSLLSKEERIAIFLPDGGDYISAFLAVLGAGMTAFPLSILITENELIPLLKQAKVKTVITQTAFGHIFESSAIKALSLKIIFTDEAYGQSVCAEDSSDFDYGAYDDNKPILLLNTSGTTGTTKIVMLSKKNVMSSVEGYLDKLQFKDSDLSKIKYILAAPLCSVYGIMIVCACLLRSFPIIVLSEAFTLDTLYHAAQRHKATHYEGSASVILLMEQMTKRAIPYDISSLKFFGFGGSKVSGKTVKNVAAAYPNIQLYQGYGMTECSPLIAKHPQSKASDKEMTNKKAESVGTAIKGLTVAIKTESSITAAPFVEGEIVVKGDGVMLGYLDNQPETDKAVKNGYLHTGDIGYLDKDGYLYISGRKKNIIIVRGFKVYPEEVESCIISSRLASDCCVYAKIDSSGNERLFADIVPANPDVDAKQILSYCSSFLADFKLPHKILLVDSVAKTRFGKTERR